ncbi:MAG: hypothetical protein PVI43_00905 [Candidatus Bathyarchaeota archaeon]|jgi:hypothetical protein
MKSLPASKEVTKVTDDMIHNLPATRKYMPKNGGTTLRMRRYNPLLTATVPLGNSGIEPPPQQLTAVDIDAAINFYGTFVLLNEQVTLAIKFTEGKFYLFLKLYTCGVNKSFLIDLEGQRWPTGRKGKASVID